MTTGKHADKSAYEMPDVGKYDSSFLPKRCIQTQQRRVAYGTSFGRKGPVGLFGPVGFKDAGWLRRLLDTKTPGPVPSLRSNCVQALKRRTTRTWRSGRRAPVAGFVRSGPDARRFYPLLGAVRLRLPALHTKSQLARMMLERPVEPGILFGWVACDEATAAAATCGCGWRVSLACWPSNAARSCEF